MSVSRRTILRSALLAPALVPSRLPDATAAPGTSEPFEFRFAHLPSHRIIRYIVPSPPKGARTWKIQLTRTGESKPIAEQTGMFPFPGSGESLPAPRLEEGTYRLTLTVEGMDAPVSIEREFTREIRPWEGNDLGKDRTVIIPPFTPLVIDRKTGRVDCILREHRMSGAGLWEEVSSQGRSLLTSPMAFVAESDGKRYRADGVRPEFSLAEDYRALGTASWSAGPLRGITKFDWDYDGMMKVTLELEPTTERIDRLSLVIPLREEETRLMHPVTDSLREHYAGRIPEGQGKVWDSGKVARAMLPGPFVPYIWVGGPERGVCWFADNDRDWISDGVTPAMEIRRENGTVFLEIRLITRPSILNRKRTIVFGLMATPAKPMPEAPRNWRAWWEQFPKADGDSFIVQWIGSCYYFGSQTPCDQYYPAFRNESVFEEFARVKRTGAIDPEFVPRRWMPQFENNPLFSEELRHTYAAHVNYTLNRLKDSWTKRQASPENKVATVLYTNARGVVWDEDTRNFLDEWTIYDIADPRWDDSKDFPRFRRERAGSYTMLDAFHYECDPVESYADMALFYQRRMYETFMDGIYYDDCFFHANYNPVPGPGYVGDDGKLHPGVGFFAFRDFIRRTAVMQHQMGLRPLIYLHMTNTNLIPILSFGTMNLDWEWRDQNEYAVKDLQDRLEVDGDASLILTQSTGLQSGNVPVSIDRFHPPKNSGVSREWLLRTQLAVAIPHEMKPSGDEAVIHTVIDALGGFGYGRPDCAVYRYWDPRFPVKTSGAKVKPLLLVRGKQALVFLGSFGPGGDCTLRLDLNALGLPAAIAATDAESGEPIQSTSPGSFTVSIKKHDFRILRIE